jgi:hypothetical protein
VSAKMAGVRFSLAFQRAFYAIDQDRGSERFSQKANGSDLQRSSTHALIGKGRDKNERNAVTPGAHMSHKVQTNDRGLATSQPLVADRDK